MKIKIIIECEVDEAGNLLGQTFEAKSCRKGPALRFGFWKMSTKKRCLALMLQTFDMKRMRKEHNARTQF